MNEYNDIFEKNGFIASIFYKGTACPCHMLREDDLKDIINNASEMIMTGLKFNVSLPEQIKDYTEQLNHMENKLVQAETNGIKSCPLDESEMAVYWLDVIALIRLKVLVNDNMNGLRVMKKRI